MNIWLEHPFQGLFIAFGILFWTWWIVKAMMAIDRILRKED